MPDNRDFKLGMYSGLFAVIMVVALAAMAFVALEPAPNQVAQNILAAPKQVHQGKPVDQM